MGSIQCSSIMALKHSRKYMILSDYITTFLLWQDSHVVELLGMTGVETFRPIVFYANVGMSSSAFQFISHFTLLLII